MLWLRLDDQGLFVKWTWRRRMTASTEAMWIGCLIRWVLGVNGEIG